MKVGIMQPYFFPYIGYWQLINAVDKFVIYDDVNFIKSGWINRNTILINGKKSYINLMLSKASPNKLINELELLDDLKNKKQVLKTIELNYKKTPYFNLVFPIVESIMMQKEKQLSKYLEHSIRLICKYLEIDTKIIMSSEIIKNDKLTGQDKIIDICKRLSANQYINSIGGRKLYSHESFELNGLSLFFLEPKEIYYSQYDDAFVPNLSIIDVMMFNDKKKVKVMLEEFELV
jgi:hypothetical protein